MAMVLPDLMIPGFYFLDKSRDFMTRMGAHPDADITNLAGWAHTTKLAQDTRAGVLITNRGRIMAHTRYVRTRPGSGERYVAVCDSHPSVVGWEQGRAIGRIHFLSGEDVIHVGYHDVCTGRGKIAGR